MLDYKVILGLSQLHGSLITHTGTNYNKQSKVVDLLVLFSYFTCIKSSLSKLTLIGEN